MRKNLFVLLLVLFTLFLNACGTSTKVYELAEDGVVIKMSFKYKEDDIIEQTTDNILPYDVVGLSSKEEAEEAFEDMADEFVGHDGISHEIEYEEDELIERLTINYEEAVYDDVKDLPGMMFDGDFTEGVSMEKTGEMLEDQGFEEK